jgi:hypothetical protein
MGYPAPRLLADESRFFLTSSAYHPTNTIVIGLGSHDGFVFQRFDPPRALSWLPIPLGYEERELLDHCKLDTSKFLLC